MNRKWMVMVWIGALALSLVLLGCPKKKPAPMPEMEPAEAAPPQEVAEPAPPPIVEDKTPDPLAGDIVEAMEYAYREGLLGDVYFDYDKYNLKPEARDRLARNADFMKQHPQFTFVIEGHCDERGTNEYNIALGDRRASAALGYINSLGVAGTRLRTISYGEERPQCTESAESCWWRNRRAHFVITGRSSG